MQWIKHDTDANQDAKLQNVLLDYGLEGYGLYWYCIELIAGKVDKEHITFELEHDARIIARNTSSTHQKVEEMMKYFVKIGLFECSNNTITCLKLAKRLDQSMTSNTQMREIIKNFRSHDAVMISSDEVMQDKNRSDQNRIDKKETKRIVSPSLDYSCWGAIPSEQVLKDWKSLRARLKAPVTQTVINRMAKEIQDAVSFGWTVDDCLAECAVRGWRGFKAEWVSGRRSSKLSAGEQTRQNLKDGF